MTQADPNVRPPSPIPDWAELIFATPRARERDPFGNEANALYVCSRDGRVERITHTLYSHNHFKVAPDRRHILVNRYSRGGETKNGRYFALDHHKELWILDTVEGTERRVRPELNAGWGGLAWSPDGKWIYFPSPTPETDSGIRADDADPGARPSMDIRRLEVASGKTEVLTTHLNALMGQEGERHWTSDLDLSADGQWLTFLYRGPKEMARGPTKPKVAMMRVDGSEARMVSDGGPMPYAIRGDWPTGDFDPTFSPDVTQVACSRCTDVGMASPALSSHDMVVLNVDGSFAYNASEPGNAGADYIPDWGDARGIVFTHLEPHRPGVPLARYPVVYDPATKTRTRIDAGGDSTHVQWIPEAR